MFAIAAALLAFLVSSNPAWDAPWKSILVGSALALVLVSGTVGARSSNLGPWTKEFVASLFLVATLCAGAWLSNPGLELSVVRTGLSVAGLIAGRRLRLCSTNERRHDRACAGLELAPLWPRATPRWWSPGWATRFQPSEPSAT